MKLSLRIVSIVLILGILIGLTYVVFNNSIANYYDNTLKFQVISSQIAFTRDDVKEIHMSKNLLGRYTLSITLTQVAAQTLDKISEINKGKKAEFVLRNHIIRRVSLDGPLSNKLIITGFTEDQAKRLVKKLK